ncbi:MAG: YkvA family protein [Candidatus Neomarinimicrobiota bacterium]|nr:YkvA family protein [Candidatus Neomarinimicrobiota bacterium]
MNTQENTFTLTQEDKLDYLDQINKFDLSKKKELMKSVPEKLQTLLQNGTLNSIQVQLINDLVHLFKLLEDNPNMDEDIQKKILFALDYFSNVDDDIPDSIPVFGLLDDSAVIKWIVNDLQGTLQKRVQS